MMGLIVLLGEIHWNRGLCIDNNGKGFVDPNTYYSPCHEPYLETDQFEADQGASWYFWKLNNKKLSSSVITWILYIIHLFINWYIIYCVQYEKEEIERLKLNQFNNIRNYKTVDTFNAFNTFNTFNKYENDTNDTNIDFEYNHNDNLLVPKLQEKYSNKLNWYNWSIFTVNLIGYFIHLITTHTIYDGLASDVSIWSNQAFVIYLVFIIFIFRIPLRGLIFGIKFNETLDRKCLSKYINIKNVIFALKKYHSYMFIWAIIYTFWYHPMEPLFGHLTGFSFIFLIFVQASLIYTNIHKNIAWTVFLECYFVFYVITWSIQNTPKWKQFTNGTILIYSITVIPMLIDYLYKKRKKKNSPLYLRVLPAVLALIFSIILRCLTNDCNSIHLYHDYLYCLLYYAAIPILTIFIAILLKLLTNYMTNNKYILIFIIIALFAGLNWFVVFSYKQQFHQLYVNTFVLITIILIQIMIAKWFWRLIIV